MNYGTYFESNDAYEGIMPTFFLRIWVALSFYQGFLSYLSFVQRLDKKGVSFCARTTYDDNAITNAVEIYDSLR